MHEIEFPMTETFETPSATGDHQRTLRLQAETEEVVAISKAEGHIAAVPQPEPQVGEVVFEVDEFEEVLEYPGPARDPKAIQMEDQLERAKDYYAQMRYVDLLHRLRKQESLRKVA